MRRREHAARSRTCLGGLPAPAPLPGRLRHHSCLGLARLACGRPKPPCFLLDVTARVACVLGPHRYTTRMRPTTPVTPRRELSKLLKCNILAYDYSGYGASTGAPSISNTLSDISTVYEHLVRRAAPSLLQCPPCSSGTEHPALALLTCSGRPPCHACPPAPVALSTLLQRSPPCPVPPRPPRPHPTRPDPTPG